MCRHEVSVIIPSYNMGSYINGAIDSVLIAGGRNVEVIVVDDGSTDNTYEVVSQYTDKYGGLYDERVRYIRQRNMGKSVALNCAIDRACGYYITILDADDELTRDSIITRLSTVETSECHPVDIVIGGFEVFLGDEVLGSRSAPSTTKPASLYWHFLLHYKTPFSLNNCLIRKDLVCSVGRFDQRLRRVQDVDYALRLLKKAKCVETVPNIVYRYRKHRVNMKDRLKLRLLTAYYRAKVVSKNVDRVSKWPVLLYGLLTDVVKMLYEIKGSYTK